MKNIQGLMVDFGRILKEEYGYGGGVLRGEGEKESDLICVLG